MPTIMNPNNFPQRLEIQRMAPQKICISLGIGFIVVGFLGVLLPGLMGMHLSMLHNFIHIGSGAIAIWSGYANSNRAISFSLWFGAIYGFLGITGFVIGEPGYPGVGHMEADQNLFRVIPDVLEFGTMDHIIHLLISTFLLLTAFTFRKERKNSKLNRLQTINRRTTLGSTDMGE